MAGQKRSSISSDSDLSHYQSSEGEKPEVEGEISQESGLGNNSGLDREAFDRIELIAKVRGVSAQNLISEILLDHLAKFETKEANFRKLPPQSNGVPLRFIDPADQISLDEDFRELAS